MQRERAYLSCAVVFFFFQAEDGIRDLTVTGVQTCALPILDNLGIFSKPRFELTPADSGNYDLRLHVTERNHWGNSKAEGMLSLLSGLPYATVYPELYNLGHEEIGRHTSELQSQSNLVCRLLL